MVVKLFKKDRFLDFWMGGARITVFFFSFSRILQSGVFGAQSLLAPVVVTLAA